MEAFHQFVRTSPHRRAVTADRVCQEKVRDRIADRSRRLRVERRLHGLDTAFRATLGNKPGPTIAILAEYDALPEIGHACGHNLIGTGAIAAAIGLTAADFAGSVVVLGTPAEEGGGGKIKLINAGAFDGIDAAMMYHPLDRDIYEMTRDEMKEMGIRTTPGSLEEAINALEADHAFLLRGGVFTEDLIQTWIDWKRTKELDPIRLRPHPHEFSLYYDN